MRAYEVTAEIPNREGDPTAFRRFAGSQSDAATVKRDLFEKHRDDGLKRGSIAIDEVEIPTNKGDLIPWLNDNLA